MADIISRRQRSALMARVRGKDTKPELIVRHIAHSMGYRYRLHRRDLPGTPDLVFPSRRKVVFVNGCFWHGHVGCRKATTPSTRTDFWKAKIRQNRARDRSVQQSLAAEGWKSLTVWECETSTTEQVRKAIQRFLGPRE